MLGNWVQYSFEFMGLSHVVVLFVANLYKILIVQKKKIVEYCVFQILTIVKMVLGILHYFENVSCNVSSVAFR